ncbi:ATP-binding protein [Altericista sp. CCNU0014]|uniref:ATP-binding protein n=1 Tax=Altericista sp. CCNU0014 TaxID=3082949 RepID=UPI00384ECD9C
MTLKRTPVLETSLQKASSAIASATQLRFYGVALLSVALALGLTLLLLPWLYPTPAALFFMAVMVSAWYGGLRAGLVAIVLSTVAIKYFFFEPYYSFTVNNLGAVVRLTVFLAVAVSIGILNQSRYKALQSAKTNLRALQEAMGREREARTASELAQRAEQAAKKRLETVLSSIDDGFYVLDRNWCITYANERLCEMMVMSQAEILGRNIWELLPDVVGTEACDRFYRAMQDRVPVQFEDIYVPWNRWYELRLYPSSSSLTVFVTDITDRKRAEEALRLNQDRLAFVLRTTGIGLWLNSLPLGALNWDERTKELFFIAPETEPTIDLFWSRIHPDDRESTRLAMEGALRDCTLYEIDHRVVNPDTGEVRWIRSAGKAIYAPDGTPVSFDGINYDISDRKRDEADLKQSNARFHMAMRAVEGIVFEWNLQTQQIYRSEGLFDLIGVRAEDALPTQEWWGERVHPDDLREIELRFSSIVADRIDRYQYEYRVRHAAGHWVDVWERGYLQYGTQGELVGVVGFTTDISARVRLEREREQILQQEQAAREAAENANRIKDEFLAVLSHELRTPLNPILGWAKLLQSGKLNAAKAAEAIITIERNAKLQSELIEDLLDISRILRGKLSLTVVPVNLAATIAAAIETVSLAANAKSIEVIADLNPEVGRVSGDATRLQQVVWNLLSNAVKFTPPGGQVAVRLARVENQALISVSDTGKGIHPDFMPHVFDHFRQEDGATTRKFGGLGLGLAIARQIVELHGGTVCAESQGEGLGSTFSVRLPLMPLEPTSNVDCSSPAPSLDLSGVRILIIDDEIDSREFVAFVLEQAGARVTTAATAAEGLATLVRTTPDVLLSDIGMPDMDGYALVRQVRALPPEEGGKVLAIALTAYAGDFNRQQALEAGFQQHLSKPIEPDELVRAIVLNLSVHIQRP